MATVRVNASRGVCVRHPGVLVRVLVPNNNAESGKAGSTLRSSGAVPHPSTKRALRRLTSEVRRDPVHSTQYDRQWVLFEPAES